MFVLKEFAAAAANVVAAAPPPLWQERGASRGSSSRSRSRSSRSSNRVKAKTPNKVKKSKAGGIESWAKSSQGYGVVGVEVVGPAAVGATVRLGHRGAPTPNGALTTTSGEYGGSADVRQARARVNGSTGEITRGTPPVRDATIRGMQGRVRTMEASEESRKQAEELWPPGAGAHDWQGGPPPTTAAH